VIIQGAMAWVEAAGTKNARFLPVLATWLAGDGWTKPPPEHWRARPACGRSPHHRNGSKVSLSRVMWNMGDRR
jgi:hypothetical protein